MIYVLVDITTQPHLGDKTPKVTTERMYNDPPQPETSKISYIKSQRLGQCCDSTFHYLLDTSVKTILEFR